MLYYAHGDEIWKFMKEVYRKLAGSHHTEVQTEGEQTP